MSAFEPAFTHPLLWFLRDVLGLTTAEICTRARISNTLVRSLDCQGQGVHEQHLVKLINLINRALNDAALERVGRSSLAEKSCWRAPELDAHRRHLFDLGNWVAKTYTKSLHTDRRQDLARAVKLAVGAGAPRHQVMADVQSIGHSAPAIRRHLRSHYKLVSENRLWRIYPRAHPKLSTRSLDDPAPPRPLPPLPEHLTKRQSKILAALERRLLDAPDGVPLSELKRILYSTHRALPTQIHLAARQLGVISTVTGFGPGKRAVWRHPGTMKLPVVAPLEREGPDEAAQAINAQIRENQRRRHQAQLEREEIAHEIALAKARVATKRSQ